MLWNLPPEMLLHIILHMDIKSFVMMGSVSKTGYSCTHSVSAKLAVIWTRCTREMSATTRYMLRATRDTFGSVYYAQGSLMEIYNVSRFLNLEDLMTAAHNRRATLLQALMVHPSWPTLFRDMYQNDSLPTVAEMNEYGHRALIVKQLDLLNVADTDIHQIIKIILKQPSLHGLLFNACVASRAICIKKRRAVNILKA